MTKLSTPIIFGERTVGHGSPVYFIAEAGSNHDGNLDQARRLIDVAAAAGADAVKFQTFRADTLYARGAGKSAYLKTARSINDIIRDLEMPLEWIPILAAHCADRGVHFLSTPFDERAADALDPHVPAFKIASYEMTHYPLVQHVARKGKPVIISTGTADLEEVRDAIGAIRAVSNAGARGASVHGEVSGAALVAQRARADDVCRDGRAHRPLRSLARAPDGARWPPLRSVPPSSRSTSRSRTIFPVRTMPTPLNHRS